jgi:hypothetical protein
MNATVPARFAWKIWVGRLMRAGYAGLFVGCLVASFAAICAAQVFVAATAATTAASNSGLASVPMTVAFAAAFACSGATAFCVGSKQLFRSRDPASFWHLPITGTELFLLRFTPVALVASWPAVIIAIPASIAFTSVTHGGIAGGAAAVGVSLLLSWCASLVAAIILLALPVLARVFRRLPSIDGIATLLLGWTALHAADIIAASSGSALATGSFREVATLLAGSAATWALSPMTPPLASGIAVALTWLATIALTAVIGPWYPRAAQRFLSAQAGTRMREMPASGRPFPRFLRWRHSFLFEREALRFLRERRIWGEFLPSVILAAVAIILVASSVPGGASSARTAFFFVAAPTAALAFRLAYPAFAREGASMKTIIASPMHLHELYSWKFFFWASLLVVEAAVLSAVAVRAFGLHDGLVWFFVAVAVAFAAVVSSVVVSAGALKMALEVARKKEWAAPAAAATCVVVAFLTFLVYIGRASAVTAASVSVMPVAAFGTLVAAGVFVGLAWYAGQRAVEQLHS